jgi:NAD-dependent deacetylase
VSLLPDEVSAAIAAVAGGSGRITVVTGAGISAESGIPTFRGPEGYWTVGSRNYTPQEMGTRAMFRRNPRAVWRWYLYRRGVCRAARPNAGHVALARIEAALGDRFTLVTQNVDGLHRRAGNSAGRTFEIHGNIDWMRCPRASDRRLFPIPDGVTLPDREATITPAQWEALHPPACGGLARPHVLWWDEYYDEALYRFNSSLAVAAKTDLLIMVGTSGSTNLPNHMFHIVLEGGGTVIDVNIRDNYFAQYAAQYGGHALRGPAGAVLPLLAGAIIDGAGSGG